MTPDYQDVLFVKGFGGIIKEAKEKISMLNEASPEDMDKIIFYRSVILTSEGIIRFANRYAEAAELMAKEERDEKRREELLNIAANCRKVPENPPETFYEAIQFVWFTQIGGILSENPLSLNPGRFDQYMNPYYQKDRTQGTITPDDVQELFDSLLLK